VSLNAQPKLSWVTATLLAALAVGVLVLRAQRLGADDVEVANSAAWGSSGRAVTQRPAPSSPEMPDRVRWLAFGGGTEPATNQVAIEQDLGLAATVLGDGGVILFAGGVGHSPVQVLDLAGWQQRKPEARGLAARLGTLFVPRDGRAAKYRDTKLEPHGAGTVANVTRTLQRVFAQPGEPLLVFVAAHGDAGQTPRENTVALWGGPALRVADLAALDDDAVRPLRLVVTSCFSGGFAELAFSDADARKGATARDRCGLFASTWDTEASGCDPNPDRRMQESYGLHFLHALARRDRAGKKLPLAQLDLDGDGAVSLLEAHSRVAIASRSLSIPTTTSERWLRHAAPAEGPDGDVSLPENEALIASLGARLHLPDAISVQRRYDTLQRLVQDADAALLAAERRLEHRWGPLRIALLERWPVLDDPYHPAYATMVEDQEEAITRFLDSSDESKAFDKADRAMRGAAVALEELELEVSHVRRLVRAQQTMALARRLARKGGPSWKHYQELLACERSVPPLD